MKFRTIVQLSGKTATGIQVPADVVAHLGPSKRPRVRVTINGHTYRSTIAPMGGVFMLLHSFWRELPVDIRQKEWKERR